MDFSIEEMAMNALPSLQTVLFDGWIIRMASGYRSQTNAIHPIYSFYGNLDSKIDYCENLFKRNELPVIFKIIGCDEQKQIDKKLEEFNYRKDELTSVQICKEIRPLFKEYENITTENNFSANWNKCFYSCKGLKDERTIETIEKIQKNILQKIICVHKMENKNIIGCGYGVIENGFIGLFDIVVKEEFRGKGYGKEIVETILSKANEKGIRKSYLQVMLNNPIAINLYKSLGFIELYKYWYRKK
jgi:GNAT superfamily N-acetyltransferase